MCLIAVNHTAPSFNAVRAFYVRHFCKTRHWKLLDACELFFVAVLVMSMDDVREGRPGGGSIGRANDIVPCSWAPPRIMPDDCNRRLSLKLMPSTTVLSLDIVIGSQIMGSVFF